MVYYKELNFIEKYLQKHHPEHLGGYQEGWLEERIIQVTPYNQFLQLFTWENGKAEIICTIIL
jgi:hypothetical protein